LLKSLLVGAVSIFFGFYFLVFAEIAYAENLEKINFPHREPLVLKIKSIDPSGMEISESTLINEITLKLLASTRMKLINDGAHPIQNIEGLRVQNYSNEKGITLRYVNVELFSTGIEYGQYLVIPLSYSVKKNEGDFYITISTPDQANLITRKQLIFPPNKIKSVDKCIEDANVILDSLKSMLINRYYKLSGELDSSFKPESIMGNFQRLLGSPVKILNEGSKLGGQFNYKAGNENRRLTISSFPYREGSKITYSIDVPYTLSTDSGIVGGDLQQQIVLDLERIIND